jgi:hypothetical protein
MLKRMRHYHSVAERELRKGENADPGIIDRALRAANEIATRLPTVLTTC